MFIWQVGGTKPVAECVSARPQPCYQRMRWTNDGSRIQGGDGWDYLEWPWEGKPSTTPIRGKVLAFGVADQREEAWIMQLVVNHAETRFLTGKSNQPGIGAADLGLRDAANPSALQRMDAVLPKGARGLMPVDFYFSKDYREIYYGSSTPCALDPATGAIREMPLPKAGWVSAFDAASGRLICVSSKGIKAVKTPELTLEWTVAAPAGVSFLTPVTEISRDRRWVGISGKARKSYALALLDTQQQRFVALQPLPQGTFQSIAFSPDSRGVALGHKSGVISLWGIEKMIAGSPLPAAAAGK